MTNLAQVFGYSSPPKYESDERIAAHDIGIGIEIEMEGFNNPAQRTFNESTCGKYWRLERDGSLRDNGIEFISTVLFGKDIIRALEAIGPVLNQCTANWRGGIHVHADVRDLDLDQMASACTLYGMLERLIFAWEGNERQDSNFCVPWYVCNDAAIAVGEVLNMASQLPEGHRIAPAHFRNLNRLGKYSALNVLPLLRQGSIEFRLMQTTNDIERIIQFVNICLTIINKARSINQNPLLVLSEIGPDRFFDEYLSLPFFKDLPDYEAALWQGVNVGNIIPAQANNIRLDAFANADDDLPLIN